jgi:hypothetical protein
MALLLRLRSPDVHHQPVLGTVDVLAVEGHQLATAERAGEPDDEQGPVPQPDRRTDVERGDQGADVGRT